jgi:hypothetical protein
MAQLPIKSASRLIPHLQLGLFQPERDLAKHPDLPNRAVLG